jgi:hypothetical protein
MAQISEPRRTPPPDPAHYAESSARENRQPPPDDTTNENPPGDGWSSGEVERGARLCGAPLISMHYLY